MLMPKVKAASKHQREKAMSTLLLGFAADPIARFFFADSARWKITVTVHSIALIVRNRVHCHRIISMAVRLHPGGSRISAAALECCSARGMTARGWPNRRDRGPGSPGQGLGSIDIHRACAFRLK